MKNRFKYILCGMLPLFAMVVSGCSGQNKGSTSTSEEPWVPSEEPEPITPDIDDGSIRGISLLRTQDFFMRKGEVLPFNATFDNAKDEEQKGVTWTSTNPNVVRITSDPTNLDKPYYINLKANREGKTTIYVRSTYSPALSAKVSITVVDSSAYTNFWQKVKDSTEPNEFLDSYGKPKTSGTVHFGSTEWSYKFDKAPIAVSGAQSLKFGSTDKPYGALHFETDNLDKTDPDNPVSRKIRKISVLCSSTAEHIEDGSNYGKSADVGSSKITIKVGDTKYVDALSTPKNSNKSDLESDTVTGATFDENPLTGKISIDFSPTYKDGATKINSGAIYLKAIIIEYFRGELDHIAIEETNPYLNHFYVGTTYTSNGIDVGAYYSEIPSEKIVVTDEAKFESDSFDFSKKFTKASDNANIHVTYKDKTADYQVEVSPKITKKEIAGELETNTYLAKEKISYKGLKLNIYSQGNEEPTQSFDLEDMWDDNFNGLFDTRSVSEYAVKSLQNSYTISLIHYIDNSASTRTISYSFPKNALVVKEVKSIDVEFVDPDNPLDLVEGTTVAYNQFNATVNYDNNESDEPMKLSELLNVKYYNYETGKNAARFKCDLTIVEKSFATKGFSITVSSTINGASSTFDVAADKINVKYLESIRIYIAEPADPEKDPIQKTYEEFDDFNYDGFKVELKYSDSETPEIKDFKDVKDMTTLRKKTASTGTVSTETVPLFDAVYPQYATKDLSNGFNIKLTSILDSAITSTLAIEKNTITVTDTPTIEYTRVDSVEDFVSGAKYIITSVEYEGARTMEVWDGDLGEDSIMKGGNHFMYTHDAPIGDSLVIKNGKVRRSPFIVTEYEKNSDDEMQYLVQYIKTEKYVAASGSLVSKKGTESAHFLMSFSEEDGAGNIGLRATASGTVKYLKFNTSTNSDKFSPYKIDASGIRHIQLYKVVGSEPTPEP